MADQNLVLAIFDDEAAADAAVESLKVWDANTLYVTLGAVGVLVADEYGNIKEHKLGARSSKKGAGIGLVLAIIAPPTLLAGIVGGGLLGHFHHKGLGLSAADRDRLGTELTGGKAAVGVLAMDDEAKIIADELARLGGAAEVHEVSDEAIEAAAAAAPADAEPAAPDTDAPATA